jgi:hypothetical protein
LVASHALLTCCYLVLMPPRDISQSERCKQSWKCISSRSKPCDSKSLTTAVEHAFCKLTISWPLHQLNLFTFHRNWSADRLLAGVNRFFFKKKVCLYLCNQTVPSVWKWPGN